MKYLVVAQNPDNLTLEWNILHTRESVEKFVLERYSEIIEDCEYDNLKIHQQILVIEIEPNYEVLALDVVKPTKFQVKLKG